LRRGRILPPGRPLLWTCGHEADAMKEGLMTVIIVAVVVMAVLVCSCVVFLRMRKGSKRG
jgi:flagellar basal body-associated protein FliL